MTDFGYKWAWLGTAWSQFRSQLFGSMGIVLFPESLVRLRRKHVVLKRNGLPRRNTRNPEDPAWPCTFGSTVSSAAAQAFVTSMSGRTFIRSGNISSDSGSALAGMTIGRVGDLPGAPPRHSQPRYRFGDLEPDLSQKRQ